jgi:hypothetical protein
VEAPENKCGARIKMKKTALIAFFLAVTSAHAMDCKSKVETLVRDKLKGKCPKSSCKLTVEQVKELLAHEPTKKGESSYRVSLDSGRVFEAIVKASDCSPITVYEVGSSDDDESN